MALLLDQSKISIYLKKVKRIPRILKREAIKRKDSISLTSVNKKISVRFQKNTESPQRHQRKISGF